MGQIRNEQTLLVQSFKLNEEFKVIIKDLMNEVNNAQDMTKKALEVSACNYQAAAEFNEEVRMLQEMYFELLEENTRLYEELNRKEMKL